MRFVEENPRRFRTLVLMGGLVIGALAASAQSTRDVHIVPRKIPEVKAGVDALDTHTAPLRADVDVVLVPVTVTDPMSRIVTGLEKTNFAVFEDKEKQHIRYFSSEDAPISMGIVLDISGSMKSKMQEASEAVVQFLRTANPQDEFFLVTFSDRPEVWSGFTRDIGDIQSRLIFAQPRGQTALLDGIYLALNRLRQAHYSRKAILVISDGGDNHSRYTRGEIKSVVKEADAQLYAIGIFDPYPHTEEERTGPELLSDITDVTGGRTYVIDNPNELADVATKIGIELRNQYVLGYVPDDESRDGKWHKIKVKLSSPKGLPPLTVYARKGYYAPEN